MRFGIDNEQLAEVVEEAMTAFTEKFMDRMEELGAYQQGDEGLVITDGEGRRLNYGEFGEVDVIVETGRLDFDLVLNPERDDDLEEE